MSPTSRIESCSDTVDVARDTVLEGVRRRAVALDHLERQRRRVVGVEAVAGACQVTFAPLPLNVPSGGGPVVLQLRDGGLVVLHRRT